MPGSRSATDAVLGRHSCPGTDNHGRHAATPMEGIVVLPRLHALRVAPRRSLHLARGSQRRSRGDARRDLRRRSSSEPAKASVGRLSSSSNGARRETRVASPHVSVGYCARRSRRAVSGGTGCRPRVALAMGDAISGGHGRQALARPAPVTSDPWTRLRSLGCSRFSHPLTAFSETVAAE